MKRSLWLLCIMCLLLGALAGCAPDAPEVTEPIPTEMPSQPEEITPLETDVILQSALLGDRPVINQKGNSCLLEEYLLDAFQAVPLSYTLVDMDADGHNEMVVSTNVMEAASVVLHRSEEKVFAFTFGNRELMELKSDGTFTVGNGAEISAYYALAFHGGGYEAVCQAQGDFTQQRFSLGGAECGSREFEEYQIRWNGKDAPMWIELVRQPAQSLPEETEPPAEEVMGQVPYLQDIPMADQRIYSQPSYEGTVTRLVEKAGIYTIVEEAWDDEGNLWGKLKSGAGWVNLTEIRSGARQAIPISVNFADDLLLDSGNYHYCDVGEPEYFVSVAIRANEEVTNLRIVELLFEGPSEEFGEFLAMGRQLYQLDRLTASKPLVADMSFPGDLSCYGVCLTDSNGQERYFVISDSGRNNGIYISESN